ncbi:AlkA N-terminal domain-containing protein [Thalassotalea nanhaiensis]|uniref:DNA-3-methyladenine glycosylase II n=1 Tax=Thalassotalea nanhaiensis TaxID=3065648 RepID=A0ABY9TLM4_9GAMM|nr:AlkA N-terminal domain-containing protein [Colwelliaceae bacterium SQ345]
MKLDPQVCMQARLSRDSRFDGKFYTAVITTGIYCRPTCPAGPAHEKNVSYYQSAAQAEFNGYQPCKRCKPELSPNQPLPKTIDQALTLITIEPQIQVADLATRLDLSERQLQRLFNDNLGVSPNTFINQKRQINARNLLISSTIAFADVALISGFGSLRSFNDHIKQQYKLTPSQIRQSSKQEKVNHLKLQLAYTGELNWPLMLSFFKARQIPGVEAVSDTYCRTINIDNCVGWIAVSKPDDGNYLSVDIWINDFSRLAEIITRVRKMFDLDCNLNTIRKQLAKHPTLKPIIDAYPGLRLPGCWDIFEFSIRAILGQQISVKAATTLAGRIAEKFSKPITDENSDATFPQGLSILFPPAETLATASFDDIGITNTRQQTLHTWIAFFIANKTLFDNPHDSERFEKTLCELKGIGPWTANYMAMRGLSLPDAFPAADLGIIKALSNKPELRNELKLITAIDDDKQLSAKQILTVAESWRPWRAYAAIYLWQSLSATNN